MTRITFGVGLAFALATVSVAEAETPEVFLSRPAPPSWWSRSGENWLALFPVNGGKRFDLKAVQSKVYVDSRDGVIKLGAQNSPDPAFFISGLKLKTGVVDLAEKIKFGAVSPLSDDTSIDFTFKKEDWKLKRKTLSKRAGAIDFALAEVSFSVSNGKKEIELGRTECRLLVRFAQTSCEEKIAINFAGDIDRDGIPDFFLTEAPDRQAADSALLLLSTLKSAVAVANADELRAQTKPYLAVIRKTGTDDGDPKRPAILIPHRPARASKSAFTFDSWYAFIPETKKLEPVKIWVACLQGQCEETQRIEISKDQKSMFLVRGINGLKLGPVAEAVSRKLPREADRDLGFESFEIEFAGAKIKLAGGTGFFTLESTAKKTVFPLKTLDPDDQPQLVWSGDLNNDGKLDLYFEVKQDAGLAHLLYISPEAATGPIAGPTAETCSGSCD